MALPQILAILALLITIVVVAKLVLDDLLYAPHASPLKSKRSPQRGKKREKKLTHSASREQNRDIRRQEQYLRAGKWRERGVSILTPIQEA